MKYGKSEMRPTRQPLQDFLYKAPWHTTIFSFDGCLHSRLWNYDGRVHRIKNISGRIK